MQCAIEIQRTLAKRNHDVTLDRRIELKIGIHIGDVVHRGGDVYGDGVNIASRIEPVAESFGDLDPMIDGREDVVEEGMEFTGFHRLEKDLWVDGLVSCAAARSLNASRTGSSCGPWPCRTSCVPRRARRGSGSRRA